MRLVDADALIDYLQMMPIDLGYREVEEIEEYVTSMPTIEPDRKKGRWIDEHCSNCGCDIPAYIIDWKWQKDMNAKFCPNCGCRIESENE